MTGQDEKTMLTEKLITMAIAIEERRLGRKLTDREVETATAKIGIEAGVISGGTRGA